MEETLIINMRKSDGAKLQQMVNPENFKEHATIVSARVVF
jgi:hypothetical protein